MKERGRVGSKKEGKRREVKGKEGKRKEEKGREGRSGEGKKEGRSLYRSLLAPE